MPKQPGKKREIKNRVAIPADVKHYIDVVRAQSNEDMERYMGALMEEHRDQIKGISERFVDFDRTLNSNTEMIGWLAEDVATLSKDVSIIKEKVTSIEDTLKTKVDREEFVALEHRVAVVEANA